MKPSLPFVVEGTLEISCNTTSARLTGRQQHLDLDLDDPGAFVKAVGMSGAGSVSLLREAAQSLYDSGMTLHVLNRGQRFLTMGYDAQTGLSGYFVPHLRISAVDAARFGLKMLTR